MRSENINHRLRPLLIVLLAAVIVALAADVLWAQGTSDPQLLLDGKNWRGPGSYMSLTKIIIAWLVFLAWAATCDWVSRDSQEMDLDWRRWNVVVFSVFLAAQVLLWLIPWFWFGLILLLLGYAGPLAAYIVYRNGRLTHEKQVLTAEHIRWKLAGALGKVGIKIAAEGRDPNVGGAPVQVFGHGGDEKTNAGRLLSARQSPGLPTARRIISQGLAARASAILLDFLPNNVSVRYMIDGIWMPQEPLERETTEPALEALKLLSGLNPQDRRNRQEGQFRIEYTVLRHEIFDKVRAAEAKFREMAAMQLTKKLASDELPPDQLQAQVAAGVEEQARERFASSVGVWTPVDKERLPKLPGIDPPNPFTETQPVSCPATLACQGTKTGERVALQFETKMARLATLDELGMRAKLQEQLRELVARPRGFVLLSAPPGGGLRTTTAVILHDMDRFVREFMAVEDEANRYHEVENVPVRTYKSAEGESPADLLPKLFREDPQVVVVRDLVDAKTVSVLCRETAVEDRLMFGTVRAKDCAEALLRVLALGVAAEEFAGQATGVLCQRLVRKLCEKCKEAYTPAPQALKQLGIPPGRIRAFYRPPQPSAEKDSRETCVECGGAGYHGQTAIFELMLIDDGVRQLLAAAPKLDLVRQAGRKAGMKTFLEEGVLLVARGVTSLPELMRVMK
jgi:type II secretory ATPase GspE/PulE/Tfp pilus assembly ATPase PilB-like protein